VTLSRQLPTHPAWPGRWAAALLLVLLLVLPAAQAAPKRAPAFALALFDGTTFRLAGGPGPAVVLLFWAPW